MATFPELEPNARSYDFGLLPLTEESSVSAGSVRFRHSTKLQNYRLTISYTAITDAQAALIRSHYQGQTGSFRGFVLPPIIWKGHNFSGDVVPYTQLWRYVETPQEEHLSIGRINVAVNLISDGPNEAAGLLLKIATSFAPGVGFSGDKQVQGFNLAATASLIAGAPYGDVYFLSDLLINNVTALLHCNGTNGSTVKTDSSLYGNTVVDLFGAASITTAVSKYGGASLAISGTTKLRIDNSALMVGSLENFTVEIWFYFLLAPLEPTISGNDRNLCSIRYGEPQTLPNYFPGTVFGNTYKDPSVSLLIDYVTGKLRLYALNTSVTGGFLNFYSSQNVAFNTWSHIAYTRVGQTYRLFLNGALVGSGTFQYGISAGRYIEIGGKAGNGATGYVDDFRVTKGIARYTANFTPPLGQHPDP